LKENFRILLRIGAYQLRYMDNVPDYAAVACTVQLAKEINLKLSGLTNAILRALIKKEVNMPPKNKKSISLWSSYLSHPEWLIEKWIRDRDFNFAKSLAEWNNMTPLIWFRVNEINYSIRRFKNYLNKNEIKYVQFEPIKTFFKIDKAQLIINSELFKNGNISVQDPAAGLVVSLLNPIENETIIDACSAPGGKASYIAERLLNKGEIIAFDIDPDRIGRLKQMIERLQLKNIAINLLDITKNKIPMAEKILLDVPCSGTGVLSKRADIRWRRNIEDVLEMHLLQRNILWSAAQYIKKGGVIIYSTCSMEIEENWMVIEAFLKSHPTFTIDNAIKYVPEEYVDSKGAIFTYPPKHKIDGGFAVRMQKND